MPTTATYLGISRQQGPLIRLVMLVLACSFSLTRAKAQSPAVSTYRSPVTDSLRALLHRPAQPDSARVLTLVNLEQEYYDNDNTEALRLGRQALTLARQTHFLRGELMALSALVRAASGAGQLPQAERWAQEVQHLAARAPYRLRRFRVEALQLLANVAVQQKNSARALTYLRQSLALLPRLALRDSEAAMLTYYGLSVAYTEQVIQGPHPADSVLRLARGYSRQFARLARERQRPDMQISALISLANITEIAGSPDSTAYYFAQALTISRANRDRAKEGYIRSFWAEFEQRRGRSAAAAAQARQAIALARAVHDVQSEYASFDVLADALAAQGKGQGAYRAAKRARQLHDSTEQVANRTELQALQVRYDTERKENRIRQLTLRQHAQQAEAARQRQRLWGLSAGLALVAVALVLVATQTRRLRRSRAQLALQNAQLAEQRDALSQARATQDQLYALIAHDLRSPVVAFSGLADLLNFYVQTANTTRLAGLGGRIRQAAQHLSELLDNLLNWAMSQRGELTPLPRPVRAAELMNNIAALYEAAATAAGVHLTCVVPDDLFVQADPDMTRTILRNLVGNALKATPTNGTVTLSASPDATGQVRLRVRDSGPGLSEALLTQLNIPGNVPLRVATTGERGAGLGLRLSRRFAEAQGGSLALHNAPPTGVEADLRLPLAPAG